MSTSIDTTHACVVMTPMTLSSQQTSFSGWPKRMVSVVFCQSATKGFLQLLYFHIINLFFKLQIFLTIKSVYIKCALKVHNFMSLFHIDQYTLQN